MSKEMEKLKTEKAKMASDALAQQQAISKHEKDEKMAVEQRIAKIKSDLSQQAKKA